MVDCRKVLWRERRQFQPREVERVAGYLIGELKWR
jgi:hypothetical protein